MPGIVAVAATGVACMVLDNVK